MLGLSEYYKVQLLTLVVRLAAWYGLEGNAGVDLSPSATKGAHTFALVFTVLVSSPSVMNCAGLTIATGRYRILSHVENGLHASIFAPGHQSEATSRSKTRNSAIRV